MSAPLCVIKLESVPPALAGSLSRWLVEASAGLWYGRPSAKVREKLWGQVVEHADGGHAVMLTSDSSETGAEIRMHGDHDRVTVEFDGLVLTGRSLTT